MTHAYPQSSSGHWSDEIKRLSAMGDQRAVAELVDDIRWHVDHADAFDRQWRTIVQGADVCGLPVEITKGQALKLFRVQDGRCALSGLPIQLGQHGGALEQKASDGSFLGRIDLGRGYAPDNVWWLHRDVGRMRSDLPLPRFLELCSLVFRRARATGGHRGASGRPAAPSKLSLATVTVEGFLRDRIEKGPIHRETAATLWRSYLEWCGEKGEVACTRKSLGVALRSLGYTSERGHVVTWFGLRLLPREGERVCEGGLDLRVAQKPQ